MNDESQSFLPSAQSPPAMPPKRRPALSADIDSQPERSSENNLLPAEESEIDPELLAELEQAVKEVGSEVVFDIPASSQGSTVTAPILEDYIDPHTVPIQYLLEQARATLKPDEQPQDSTDNNATLVEENEY